MPAGFFINSLLFFLDEVVIVSFFGGLDTSSAPTIAVAVATVWVVFFEGGDPESVLEGEGRTNRPFSTIMSGIIAIFKMVSLFRHVVILCVWTRNWAATFKLKCDRVIFYRKDHDDPSTIAVFSSS